MDHTDEYRPSSFVPITTFSVDQVPDAFAFAASNACELKPHSFFALSLAVFRW